MAGALSLFDKLVASGTKVDYDALDAEFASKFKKLLHDCTSNQAIAYAELTKTDGNGKPIHQGLIQESLKSAHWMFSKQTDATMEELAIELMMVGLNLGLAPYIAERFLVQVNPKLAYSTARMVKNAERIVSHFHHLAPEFDTNRVCIKIPATWEGLQACRELEGKGIATLATIVFSMPQVALAGDAGCHYIAPYVKELAVHFDSSHVESETNSLLSGMAKHSYESQGNKKTKVMPASLTSVSDVMRLTGLDYITLAPKLLEELVATPVEGWQGQVGSVIKSALEVPSSHVPIKGMEASLRDESLWRLSFMRSDGGKAEAKMLQALNIFCDFQDMLEELVTRAELNP